MWIDKKGKHPKRDTETDDASEVEPEKHHHKRKHISNSCNNKFEQIQGLTCTIDKKGKHPKRDSDAETSPDAAAHKKGIFDCF